MLFRSVEQGGKLIIENGKGSEMVFNSKGTDNPILLQGEMIVNAPIRVNGAAYFDVYPTHQLTLNTTFQLTGGNHEMVRLQKSTYLKIVNQDVAFDSGVVSYNR